MTFNSGNLANDDCSSDDRLVLDLTDEAGLFSDSCIELDVNRVRGLLSALRLVSSVRSESGPDAAVFDLAMYKATGSAHLAELFCREFRSTR